MNTAAAKTKGNVNKNVPASLIRAEANILRYPIFYLHTKGLSTIDIISCEGSRTVDGKSQDFRLTASRNSRFLYPGPMARKAHHALMSILQKRGLPYPSSVEFTWRQLAREMQISWAGTTTTKRLKNAIRSIAGLLITSESALIDGESREPLQEVERGFRLYDEYVFANMKLEDGSTANRNRIKFSDWFISNLNHKYFATYRFDIWLELADKSVIASRLYEYLLHSFYGNHPVVTINYSRLCQFLPTKEHSTQYRAERQLNTALHWLVKLEILQKFDWQTGAKGQLKLRLKPGELLRPNKTPSLMESRVVEKMTVSETHSSVSPAEELVQAFYSKWNSLASATTKPRETQLAEQVIEKHGRQKAGELLRYVLKILKTNWPDAQRFGATRDYWEPAAALLKKTQGHAIRESNRLKAEIESRQKADDRREQLRKQWEATPESEQKALPNTFMKLKTRQL